MVLLQIFDLLIKLTSSKTKYLFKFSVQKLAGNREGVQLFCIVSSLALAWYAPLIQEAAKMPTLKFLSLLKKIFFIYLFLAALGLRCCVQAFSSCSEQELVLVAVHGLLIAVASLVAEHGL